MKPGQASQTAVLVCAARAIAHSAGVVPAFSDPTALELLPEPARAMVEAHRAGPPKSVRARFRYEFMAARAAMMAVRTVVIDEAVREAAAPQLVILGAGFDGRAWRMPELRSATVYEVDHPDTQREKRRRTGSLTQQAGELKFVAVDFTKDDLGERLAAAGHDPLQRTTWIWEGVVMYLSPPEVEATLRVVAARSAADSRLVIVYIGPGGWIVPLVGLMVRRLGEPFRSRYRASEMCALLARYGFEVRRDESLPASASRVAPTLGKASRRVRHMHTVIADASSSRQPASRTHDPRPSSPPEDTGAARGLVPVQRRKARKNALGSA
jgi:methyltransferase (TIGR00027 family)